MSNKTNPLPMNICFVSLDSYPLVTQENLGYAGGAEVQQIYLAKELQKRGYTISFITYDETKKGKETINGITILPAYPRHEIRNLYFLKKARTY